MFASLFACYSQTLPCAQVFNPERYLALAQVMAKVYAASGQPTQLLECYLSVFTTQKVALGGVRFQVVRACFPVGLSPRPQCLQETWAKAKYDDRMALVAGSVLPTLFRAFGEQAVLLWNAMLLRKRVIVYAESLKEVLPVVRTLPQFVWHRQVSVPCCRRRKCAGFTCCPRFAGPNFAPAFRGWNRRRTGRAEERWHVRSACTGRSFGNIGALSRLALVWVPQLLLWCYLRTVPPEDGLL